MPKHPGGRPSEYTQDLADLICHELAMGKSLRSVCKPDEMPSVKTIFNWFRTYPEFLQQYTRAKEEASDALVDDMLAIADFDNKDDTQRARLRIETRKWIASKLKPKKYGDKLDLQSSDGSMTPKVIIESVYSDEPKFRTDSTDAEADDLAEDSSTKFS